MKEVHTGFSNRQGVDIGIIGKYAKLYLHTVFDKIFVVKGATTAAFRKVWGLQSVYEKKERINHVHHCVDAITIACIGKKQYDDWKCYQEAEDMYYRGETGRPSMDKPWSTFTEDVKQLTEGLLIHHYVPDVVAFSVIPKGGRCMLLAIAHVCHCISKLSMGRLNRMMRYGMW